MPLLSHLPRGDWTKKGCQDTSVATTRFLIIYKCGASLTARLIFAIEGKNRARICEYAG